MSATTSRVFATKAPASSSTATGSNAKGKSRVTNNSGGPSNMNNPPANNSASTSGGSSSTPSVNRPPSESRSSDTVRIQSPSANSSTRNSLFSAGSEASRSSSVVEETNRVACQRGHSSFSELRSSEGGAAPSDTESSRNETAPSTADLTTDDELISRYSGS
ncbi:hypothetical protein L218DRAFT_1001062 [Marasmius fiardii PR-910]|nr:hypothetical protein L218DRAFT_1001062 [Marasmius fiardii PR-910]